MIRAYIKSKLSRGTQKAIRQAITEFTIQRRHRAALAKADRFRPPIKLNLGCGENVKQGWVNIDVLEPGADLALDLREPLPFADGAATLIYSEHFLEHLEYPNEMEQLLREAWRVLASRGVFSAGVPDAAPGLIAYARGEREAFSRNLRPQYPPWFKVPMHRINHGFRQFGEHKYAYDEEILTQALRDAGFVEVRRREFDPAVDSEDRREGTLYVEAVKP